MRYPEGVIIILFIKVKIKFLNGIHRHVNICIVHTVNNILCTVIPVLTVRSNTFDNEYHFEFNTLFVDLEA